MGELTLSADRSCTGRPKAPRSVEKCVNSLELFDAASGALRSLPSAT
eukprot:COSAG01_NODE_12997_length_1651_cov_1.161727_3_plen_46_part_01